MKNLKKIVYAGLFLVTTLGVTNNLSHAYTFKVNDKTNIDLYGNIYFDLFYNYGNSEISGNKLLEYGYSVAGGEHTFGSKSLVGSTNLGVKVSYDKMDGLVEFGFADVVRKAYMQYNFNRDTNHYLLLGRDTTIAAYSFGQVSNDFNALNDYGTLADKRRLQLRYGIHGFNLALILPYAGEYNKENVNDAAYSIKYTNSETGKEETYNNIFKVIPRLETSYEYSNDMLSIRAFGGYALYQFKNQNDKLYEVAHSFNVGVGGKFNFEKRFVEATVWYGMNQGLTGGLSNYNIMLLGADSPTKKVRVNEVYSVGTAIMLGETFKGFITPQVGIGYTANFGPKYEDVDDALGAFINIVIKVNDYLTIIPEIAYMNKMSDGRKNTEGYIIHFGLVSAFSF